MRQPDFALKTRHVLLGLGAASALLLGATPTYAQMTIPTNHEASVAVSDSESAIGSSSHLADADNQLDGTLIASTESLTPIQVANTQAENSEQNANTSTEQAKNTSPESNEEYTGSMIKPNRPQLHMYKTHKEPAPQPMSTSLVDVAGTTPTPPLTIVVYFAAPEVTENQDVDSLTGASLINRNDKQMSITGYMADYIGHKLEAGVYKLQPQETYPQAHEELIQRSISDRELISAKDFDLKVSLSPEIDLTKVDRIFLGYPLWWNDLPLPVYSFLLNTDLSGKTIIPFCTYGNNAPYQLFNIFKKLEPNAKIQRGIALDKHRLVRNDLHKKVDRWLEDMQPTDTK